MATFRKSCGSGCDVYLHFDQSNVLFVDILITCPLYRGSFLGASPQICNKRLTAARHFTYLRITN